jgi:hypothetical protein
VLIKSVEADATLDVLRADQPHVAIADKGTYWHLSADGEIIVDLSRVGEELGEAIALTDWLVVLSTFVGRVVTDPHTFRVTSHMTDLDPAAQAA